MAQQMGSGSADLEKRLLTMQTAMISPLKSMKVADLTIPRKAIILSSDMKIKEALSELVKNHIRCAPVRDATRFVGVLDIRDSLKYAVQTHKREFHGPTASSGNANASPTPLESVSEKKSAGSSPVPRDRRMTPPLDGDGNVGWFTNAITQTTENLSYLARMRPFRILKKSASVHELMRLLCSGNHIVGILDEDGSSTTGSIKGILSQGEVFKQLGNLYWKRKPQTIKSAFEDDSDGKETEKEPMALCSMNDLQSKKYVISPVASVTTEKSACDVFNEMAMRGLSGLAVIDSETGSLLYNTSSTDIKLWLSSNASLEMPIEDFLVKIRQNAIHEEGAAKKGKGRATFPVSRVQGSDSFEKVVQRILKTRYHRLYVVDSEKKPLGVCSLTDIFRFLTDKLDESQ